MSEGHHALSGPRVELVKRQIESAFADVPYPGDGRIAADENDWESIELNKNFKDYPWNAVPPAALKWHHDNLGWFSPAGLRYYLPTYLFAALEDFWDLRSFVIYHLEMRPPEDDPEHLRDFFLQRFDGFTPAQKNAVKAFLELMRNEAEPDLRAHAAAALERYWGRDWTAPPPHGTPHK